MLNISLYVFITLLPKPPMHHVHYLLTLSLFYASRQRSSQTGYCFYLCTCVCPYVCMRPHIN